MQALHTERYTLLHYSASCSIEEDGGLVLGLVPDLV